MYAISRPRLPVQPFSWHVEPMAMRYRLSGITFLIAIWKIWRIFRVIYCLATIGGLELGKNWMRVSIESGQENNNLEQP